MKGYTICHIFDPKYRLWILVRNMKKIKIIDAFLFLLLKENDFVIQSVLLYPVLWNAKVTCVVFT